MRNLFIVLAKVVGLLQVATVIWYCESLFRSLYAVRQWSQPHVSGEIYTDLFSRGLVLCLYLGFAWVLLFRSSWIADRLGLPDNEIHIPEPNLLLWIGIKLFGLYVLVEAAPALIWAVMELKGILQGPKPAAGFLIRILPAAVKLLLGLLLVGKTKGIIEVISQDLRPKEPSSD